MEEFIDDVADNAVGMKELDIASEIWQDDDQNPKVRPNNFLKLDAFIPLFFRQWNKGLTSI
jgi:hypothetical protein